MLFHLCPELLHEIGTQLAPSDQKRLRTVCRELNAAMQPLACSCLVVKLTEDDLCGDMLTRISSGMTGWSRWATMLRILPGVHEYSHTIATVPASQAPVLTAALMSLKNLHTISWKMHTNDAEWTRDVVCAFLSVAHGIRDFQLQTSGYHMDGDVPLGAIRGLRKLTANAPYWGPKFPVPQIAKNIVENRNSLTSIHLVHSWPWREIWTLLLSDDSLKELRLLDVTTNIVTLDLLKYPSSYSGLRRLKLIRIGGRNQDESNRLADVFIETVLPLHEDSLVELSYTADLESRWSFGRHCENAISRLHRSEVLGFSVDFDDVSPRVEPENNAVMRLLSIAARLPALAHLSIVGSGAEHNRGARCGNPKMNHRARMNRAINLAVSSFRTDIPSRATVYAGRKWYAQHLASAAGDLTTQSETETALLAYEEFNNPDSKESHSLFY
ncbi:hypothetical protein MSAN_00605200 [Mycena sanguinolenta]|uniref:F-box domain-containing protein n=1 Tax=Mycena sanguinolenta TaxID=230812 RepID=A0A8H6Z7W0_9AGAR|nr:hypothetical protein MSAN_00605200 [Mycena sanguinolenta]